MTFNTRMSAGMYHLQCSELSNQERNERLCLSFASLSIEQLRSDAGSDHLTDARQLPASAQKCDLCHLILCEALENPGFVRSTSSGSFPNLNLLLEELGVSPSKPVGLNLRLDRGLLESALAWKNEHGESTRYLLVLHGLRIFSEMSSGSDLSTGLKQLSCADSPTAWSLQAPENSELAMGSLISTTPDLHYLSVLVQHWMNECYESHPACSSKIPDELRPLPTRVLDLGFDGLTMKLLHASGMKGRYIALSHCWGPTQPLKTTKASLTAHTRGITVKDLPKTFSDAVRVTRCLGVRYLWIDSLAIVQDDPEDWKREAAKMGDVFGNAYMTIAASRSTSSSSGFLGARTEDRIVNICPTDSAPCCIGRRHIFTNDVDYAPLAERAWVMQERVLSRRTLHFTSTQIYWECWTRHQGEDLDDLHLGVSKIDVYPPMLSPGDPEPDIHDNRCHRKRTPRQWWHLLSSYTAGKLTYQTDRLVAISGLMSRISQATGQTSVSGLFKDQLYAGLLWSATDTPLQRQNDLQAPSWSWVSRTGPINHIQLYEFAINDDEVYLNEPCTDTNASLTAKCRILRHDVTFSELKHSSAHRRFPPELNNLPTNFRFISPNWIEDEDELGWLTIDDDDGSPRDWNSFGWVVVACVEDDEDNDKLLSADCGYDVFEKGPFYCLLVQYVSGNVCCRVGAAAVRRLTWFEDSETDIVIV